QHFRRLQFLRGQTPHNSDGHRSVERRGRSLPAHVSQRNSQLLRSVAQKLVKVAAHLPRGKIPGGHLQTVILRRHWPQERALNSFRRLQISLQSRLVARQLLVTARIFQRDGEVRRQN